MMKTSTLNITDCHAHVLGDIATYPVTAAALYPPPLSTVQMYKAFLDGIGATRCVVVQPSIYGTDNRCTLDAVKELGPSSRAVVALDSNDAALMGRLREFHDIGTRGIRVNHVTTKISPDLLNALARAIAPYGWHIQIFAEPKHLIDIVHHLPSLPVDTVLDHMGMIPVAQGIDHPLVDDLLRLLEKGRTWVKLSAAYRLGSLPPYLDFAPLARKLYDAAPQRSVWGSDWPHTNTKPYPSGPVLLDALRQWLGDEAAAPRVLSENPATLYDFPA